MDQAEANARFAEADELYRIGDYAGALYILDDLDRAFPRQHRLLAARARCLSAMDRFDEALAICDRLIDDFGYAKAEALRERIVQRRIVSKIEMGGGSLALPDEADDGLADEGDSGSSLGCARLIKLTVFAFAVVVCALLVG